MASTFLEPDAQSAGDEDAAYFKLTLGKMVFSRSGDYLVGRSFLVDESGTQTGYFVWCAANGEASTFLQLHGQ